MSNNLRSLSLGERLRFYREDAGLTQKELAEKVGLIGAYISAYELESKNPLLVIPLIKITEIAEVLNVSFSDLVTEQEMKSVNFGRKLRFYRSLQGLTKEELAGKMQMSVEQINQYETTEKLSNQMTQKFADVLNIPLYFLSSNIDTNTDVESMSFGEKIKFYRLEMGMNQKTLCEKTGINPTTISKYETDIVMEINFVNVIRIATVLNIPCKSLMKFEENIDDINSLPFGMKLKYYRETKNMSQDDLAEKLNTYRSVVSAYESGVRIPNIVKISCIAEALEIPIKFLTDTRDVPINLFNFMT